jgi:hypothetical protein
MWRTACMSQMHANRLICVSRRTKLTRPGWRFSGGDPQSRLVCRPGRLAWRAPLGDPQSSKFSKFSLYESYLAIPGAVSAWYPDLPGGAARRAPSRSALVPGTNAPGMVENILISGSRGGFSHQMACSQVITARGRSHHLGSQLLPSVPFLE